MRELTPEKRGSGQDLPRSAAKRWWCDVCGAEGTYFPPADGMAHLYRHFRECPGDGWTP